MQLKFADGEIRVRGTAMITGRGRRGAVHGLILRFVDLAPDSIQFALGAPENGDKTASPLLSRPAPTTPTAPKTPSPHVIRRAPDVSEGPTLPLSAPPAEPAPQRLPTPPPIARAPMPMPAPPIADPGALVPPMPAAPVPPMPAAPMPAAPVPPMPAAPMPAPPMPAPPMPASPMQAPPMPAPQPDTIAGLDGPRPEPRRLARRWRIIAVVAAAATLGLSAIAIVTRGDGEQPAAEVERAATEPVAERSAAAEALALADKRIAEGRLTGPGDDNALAHLLAAAELAPDDSEVMERRAMLADAFERLADEAIAADSVEESVAHLRAAALADPQRKHVAEELARAEELLDRLSRDAGSE